MRNKPTLREIAERVGVSAATVSLVINEKGNISEETRLRIKTIVRQSGYRRRPPGDTIAYAGRISAGLTRHLQQAAAEYGYGLREVSLALDGNPSILSLPEGLSGIVIHGGQWSEDLLEKLSAKRPTVLLGGSIPSIHVDSVWIDNAEAIYGAAKRLISCGHRHIGFVNGPEDTITSWEKRTGFERAIKAHPHVVGLVVGTKRFSREDGQTAARELVTRLPAVDAVIAGEAGIAISVLDVLHELGMGVPHDVSVIAFHDRELLMTTSPPLTAIDLREGDIAREAIKRLLGRIQTPTTLGKRLLLKPIIKERLSVRDRD